MRLPVPGRAVVGHLRELVHVPADAVADVLAHDRVPVGLDERLDGGADVADVVARPGGGDAEVERLAGGVDEPAHLRGGLAAGDRESAVRPPAIEDQPAVERDEVAVVDHLGAGDAVDHLLVDRHAERVGESVVAEEARDAVMVADEGLRPRGRDRAWSSPHVPSAPAARGRRRGSCPETRIFSISSGRFRRKLSTPCGLMRFSPARRCAAAIA